MGKVSENENAEDDNSDNNDDEEANAIRCYTSPGNQRQDELQHMCGVLEFQLSHPTQSRVEGELDDSSLNEFPRTYLSVGWR